MSRQNVSRNQLKKGKTLVFDKPWLRWSGTFFNDILTSTHTHTQKKKDEKWNTHDDHAPLLLGELRKIVDLQHAEVTKPFKWNNCEFDNSDELLVRHGYLAGSLVPRISPERHLLQTPRSEEQ